MTSSAQWHRIELYRDGNLMCALAGPSPEDGHAVFTQIESPPTLEACARAGLEAIMRMHEHFPATRFLPVVPGPDREWTLIDGTD